MNSALSKWLGGCVKLYLSVKHLLHREKKQQRCVWFHLLMKTEMCAATFLKYAGKYGWRHPFMARICCANLRRDQREPKHVVPMPHSLLLGKFFYLAHCVLSWCHVLHLRFTGVFLRKVLLRVWEVIVTCSQKPEDKSSAIAEIRFWVGKVYFLKFFLSSPPSPFLPLPPPHKETVAGCQSTGILKNPYMHKYAQPYHKWKMCWSPNVICLIIRMLSPLPYVTAMVEKGPLPSWASAGIGHCLST